MKRFTYGDLRSVLLHLGYVERQLPSGHVTFWHEPSDVLLIYPPFQEIAIVRPAHYVSARKQSIESGVTDEETWDDLAGAARLRHREPDVAGVS